MSETRHYRGTLAKVNFPDDFDREAFYKQLLIANGVEMDDYYDEHYKNNLGQIFNEELSDKHLYINNELYFIHKEIIDPDEFFVNLVYDESNDVYNFDCKFYDGSSTLYEILDEEMKKKFNYG